jgi:hypothetical protein
MGAAPQADGITGPACKPKLPPYPACPYPTSPPETSPWPEPLASIPDTNKRTASDSAFAASAPGPPKNEVPMLRKPPNKFGNSDKPDPIPEFKKLEPPKDEFPKPESPKREPPK